MQLIRPSIRKFKILLALGGLIILLSQNACYYDVEEVLYGGNGCDSVNVTYGLSVLPILQTHCYLCHDKDAAFGGIVLDEYQGVKTLVDNGLFWGVIQHSPGFAQMPKDRPKLNQCNIAIIERWLLDGAPNN